MCFGRDGLEQRIAQNKHPRGFARRSGAENSEGASRMPHDRGLLLDLEVEVTAAAVIETAAFDLKGAGNIRRVDDAGVGEAAAVVVLGDELADRVVQPQ